MEEDDYGPDLIQAITVCGELRAKTLKWNGEMTRV